MSNRVIPRVSTLSTLGIVSSWKFLLIQFNIFLIFEMYVLSLHWTCWIFLPFANRQRLIRFGIQIAPCQTILNLWSLFLDLRALHLVEFLDFPSQAVCRCLTVCHAVVVAAAPSITRHLWELSLKLDEAWILSEIRFFVSLKAHYLFDAVGPDS